ncbi:MAG: glycosyltransferase family 4 protein, partial [Clostridia bacterium]|nr:glycosyltransferase family 4 protein [Clostridia bacterium]
MGKVVWIINHYALTPAQGGLCRHYYFAKELISRGYTVRIFSSSTIHNTDINMIGKNEKCFFKDVEYNGVTYTYLKSNGYKGNGLARIKNMLGFAYGIKKIWKKYSWEKPDIIYTSSPDIFTAWKAEKFAKKHRLPCVVEVRDLWPLSIVEYKGFSEKNPAIRILYNLEKKIYKRADALVFTMPGGKDYVKDKKWQNKVAQDKIFNINNGVDIKEQIAHRSEFVLDDIDLNDDTFKVIYAGSIRAANSVEMLIKAAEKLKD